MPIPRAYPSIWSAGPGKPPVVWAAGLGYVASGGLDVALVHGAHGAEVLHQLRVEGPAPLHDVAPDSPSKADVRRRIPNQEAHC